MRLGHVALDISRKLFSNWVFTIHHGIAKGHKRRFGLGFVPKWSESLEDRFMSQKNFEGQTVYDIGGYVGLYSLFFASRVGEKGKVVTFEPNPTNFEELNFNLRLNGFTNAETHMVAVGDKPGKLEMATSPYLTSRGSLSKEWQETVGSNEKKFFVDVIAIDEWVEKKKLPKPDFIKIDVEAYELPVLLGMEKTLKRYHPTLLVEVHGPLTAELCDVVLRNGYRVTHLELGQEIKPGHIPTVEHGHLYCEYIQ